MIPDEIPDYGRPQRATGGNTVRQLLEKQHAVRVLAPSARRAIGAAAEGWR